MRTNNRLRNIDSLNNLRRSQLRSRKQLAKTRKTAESSRSKRKEAAKGAADAKARAQARMLTLRKKGRRQTGKPGRKQKTKQKPPTAVEAQKHEGAAAWC